MTQKPRLRTWRRHPTSASGAWRWGRKPWWRRFGVAVNYYRNTTNLPGMQFYTVQVALPLVDVSVHFNRSFQHPDAFYETFDKRTGKVGDLRKDNPGLARHMAPYMREGRFEWDAMFRFPWKYQSMKVTTTWGLDL